MHGFTLVQKAIGLVLMVCTVAASYAVNNYRLTEIERRTSQLESIKADQTALIVQEQSRQIGELTRIVAADHDALIRLAASLERQQVRSN